MELYIIKTTNGKEENYSYNTQNMVQLSDKCDLLLVDRGEMNFSKVADGVNSKNEFLKIYKIQFICKCDIEIAKGIIVAFYINSNGYLAPYVLSDLPNNYYQSTDEINNCIVVDYKSYLDICEFTNEKPVSLQQYIENKYFGSLDPNSLLKYEDKYYNADSASEIYDKIGGVNSN